MTAKNDQFGRKWQLILAVGTQGFDLSELHLRFETQQASYGGTSGGGVIPSTCFARVYNLAPATLNKIKSLSPNLEGGQPGVAGSPEGARLIIQAGYETGNYGVIFDGTVIQLRSGKESNVDSFLEISASDLDSAYNFGFVNRTLGPGATPAQQAEAAVQGMQASMPKGQPLAVDTSNLFGGVLPRGKVMFGMSRDYLETVGASTGTTFINRNGTLVAMPLTGYLPGEAVQINSATGMVGIPELTQNGLEVRCLLNPRIMIGTRIQVNQRDLTSSQLTGQVPGGINIANTRFASFNADGVYRALVLEHSGDTRGNPWYTDVVALSVDPSAAPAKSVQKYG